MKIESLAALSDGDLLELQRLALTKVVPVEKSTRGIIEKKVVEAYSAGDRAEKTRITKFVNRCKAAAAPEVSLTPSRYNTRTSSQSPSRSATRSGSAKRKVDSSRVTPTSSRSSPKHDEISLSPRQKPKSRSPVRKRSRPTEPEVHVEIVQDNNMGILDSMRAVAEPIERKSRELVNSAKKLFTPLKKPAHVPTVYQIRPRKKKNDTPDGVPRTLDKNFKFRLPNGRKYMGREKALDYLPRVPEWLRSWAKWLVAQSFIILMMTLFLVSVATFGKRMEWKAPTSFWPKWAPERVIKPITPNDKIPLCKCSWDKCLTDDDLGPYGVFSRNGRPFCVSYQDAPAIMEYVRLVYDYARSQWVNQFCSPGADIIKDWELESYVFKNMPEEDRVAWDYTQGSDAANGNYTGLYETIVLNPQWKLQFLDYQFDPIDGKKLHSIYAIKSLEGPQNMKYYYCHVRTAISEFVEEIWNFVVWFGLFLVLPVFLLVLFYMIWQENRKIRKTKEEHIKKLAARIKAVVREEKMMNKKPIAVEYLKELLTSPYEPHKLKAWNAALESVLFNEVFITIREGVTTEGEPIKELDWVGPLESGDSMDGSLISDLSFASRASTGLYPDVFTSVSTKKYWQGVAFDDDRRDNRNFPSDCLKIRNMFLASRENQNDLSWIGEIRDAILEKCGPNVRVTHMHVDHRNDEGMVLMRCLTQQDAGAAYRALHASWFDGRLVTCKYVVTEKYLRHFPSAAKQLVLRPSNSDRSSMRMLSEVRPANSSSNNDGFL